MSVFGNGTFNQRVLDLVEALRAEQDLTSLQTVQALLAVVGHYTETLEYEDDLNAAGDAGC